MFFRVARLDPVPCWIVLCRNVLMRYMRDFRLPLGSLVAYISRNFLVLLKVAGIR